MPTGFVYTTAHNAELPAGDLLPEEAVLLAIESAKALQWQIRGFAGNGLLLSTPQEQILILFFWDKLLVRSVTADNRAHDWGRNRRNINQFTAVFDKQKETYLPTEPVSLDGILTSYPHLQDADRLYPKLYGQENPVKQHGLFRDGFLVTPLLIAANFLVFVLMLASGADLLDPGSRDVMRWGGNFVPATVGGEWWRILTAQFVHIGIIHLLTNMVALVFVGMTLEPLFGKTRFLTVYILSGVYGSLLSMYLHPGNLSAGASGCIFGLLGVFLALLSVNLTDRENRRRLLPILAIYVLYLLAGGMKEQHVDVAAHGGGLLGGLLLGYAFLPSLNDYSNKSLKYRTILQTVLATLALVLLYSLLIT